MYTGLFADVYRALQQMYIGLFSRCILGSSADMNRAPLKIY